MERTNKFLSNTVLTEARRSISKEKNSNKFDNVANFLAAAYAKATTKSKNDSINNVNPKDLESFIRNFFKGDVLGFKGSQENLEKFCSTKYSIFFKTLREELKEGLKNDDTYQDLKHVALAGNYKKGAQEHTVVGASFGVVTTSVKNLAKMVANPNFSQNINSNNQSNLFQQIDNSKIKQEIPKEIKQEIPKEIIEKFSSCEYQADQKAFLETCTESQKLIFKH